MASRRICAVSAGGFLFALRSPKMRGRRAGGSRTHRANRRGSGKPAPVNAVPGTLEIADAGKRKPPVDDVGEGVAARAGGLAEVLPPPGRPVHAVKVPGLRDGRASRPFRMRFGNV